MSAPPELIREINEFTVRRFLEAVAAGRARASQRQVRTLSHSLRRVDGEISSRKPDASDEVDPVGWRRFIDALYQAMADILSPSEMDLFERLRREALERRRAMTRRGLDGTSARTGEVELVSAINALNVLSRGDRIPTYEEAATAAGALERDRTDPGARDRALRDEEVSIEMALGALSWRTCTYVGIRLRKLLGDDWDSDRQPSLLRFALYGRKNRTVGLGNPEFDPYIEAIRQMYGLSPVEPIPFDPNRIPLIVEKLGEFWWVGRVPFCIEADARRDAAEREATPIRGDATGPFADKTPLPSSSADDS